MSTTLRWLRDAWEKTTVSDVPLGKYIIFSASLMHYLWAILLLANINSQFSTPLHIISEVCGGRFRAAFVLFLVASTAVVFPFVRHVGRHAFAAMLIPQQTILALSAGAGMNAAINEHYADGVERGWAFILGDQSPMICLALLYTIAVVYAAWADDRVVNL